MTCPKATAAAVLLGLPLLSGAIDAAALRVTPVTIERTAPAVAASLTLSNADSRQLAVQVRVFRWRQVNGKDVLEPTSDVAVSPPMAMLPSKGESVVRVVRLSKAPIASEESYRILVDELPTPAATSGSAVRLLLRYSIPAFFRAAAAGAPRVGWEARLRAGQFELTGRNTGGHRLKVGDVSFRDAAGREFSLAHGLTGYVLSDSQVSWRLPAGEGRQSPTLGQGVLRISADGESTDVPVALRAGN